MNIVDKVVERKLTGIHILVATFLGKMAEHGYLNQGALNLVIPEVTKNLVEYLKFKYPMSINDNMSEEEKIKKVMEILISELDPFPQPLISLKNDKIDIAIETNKCKFCPIGVGGAELPGTLCMFPELIKQIINSMLNESYEVSIPLTKVKGRCLFELKKK